jgi:hypothetical protein
MINSQRGNLILAAILFSLVCAPKVLAQLPSNYSPGSIGADPDDTPKGGLFSGKSPQAAPAPANGPGTVAGAGFDNTADEKRMQKKYKANMSHFKDLISKGDAMMKSAANKEDRTYKKGKILKEMGEKHLADMQANSPFAIQSLEDKKDKVK